MARATRGREEAETAATVAQGSAAKKAVSKSTHGWDEAKTAHSRFPTPQLRCPPLEKGSSRSPQHHLWVHGERESTPMTCIRTQSRLARQPGSNTPSSAPASAGRGRCCDSAGRIGGKTKKTTQTVRLSTKTGQALALRHRGGATGGVRETCAAPVASRRAENSKRALTGRQTHTWT